jgi:hypothetical protein
VLKITSEQNDFGEVAVGKTATRSFTVSNSGGTNVTITKSKPPSGGAFAATTTLSEGTTLTPGESLTETVSFTPTTPGSTSGVWLITGNDSTGPHEVTFSGMGTGTFGKTSAGASSDSFRMDRKRVSRYALSSASSVSKLSIYLAPAGPAGQQVLKGVIYGDSGNAPGALLGASEQLTFTSTNSAGWYDLSFSSPPKLAAGNYWIGVITGATSNVAGFRYDSVASSRDYNANTYTSAPSEPFGAVTTDAEQMSLYATYAPVQLSVPVNTAPPTITGTAQQGQTLTEHHGTWANEPTSYSYQWQQCDSSGNGCLPISGATAQTYVPVAGDVGHRLKVQEIASNAGGSSAAATSEATASATPPAPTNSSPPTITGTAQQGQTLTEHNGSWTNEPTSVTHQWLQCDSSGASCKAISGATGQTYVPVPGDVGHAIRVEETASNTSGPGSPATSAATAAVVPPPPESISPPTITGTAQQGQTLTEHHGTWANEPTSYSYQWQQCDSLGSGCLAIVGATAQTYVPVAGDVGHRLKVQEIASNAGGSSAAATSEATAVVVSAPVPMIVKAPTINGAAQQEKTLAETHGEWTNGPTSFTYQWQQCNSEGNSCTPISGATAQTYSPVTADVGHRLRVQETASNEGGSSAPASSEATAVVIPPVATNVKPPTITGAAQQGQTLTEHNGEWTNSPTSFSYQWLQCDGSASNCVAIAGATKQTYVPVAGDVGHKLRVQEVATNAGGSGAPATSEAPPVVVPPVPVDQTAPTITGTPQQGQTLTEHHGAWTNEPTSYSYQWLQCDSLGNGCLPIAGAAAQTYVPLASDVGHTIEVQETAKNAGGSSSPAISSPTAVVSAPPVPSTTAPPTITGTAQQGQLLTAQNGSWTNEPTSFVYQWQRCDTSGANCSSISTATAQTYTPTSPDVGSTLRVQVTAANAAGSSVPSSSAQTAVVQQANATLGKATVGASTDSFRADRKRVNRYALAGAGTLVKVSIYLAPSGTAGQQVLKGLVYADSSNAPGALLATTEQLTFKSTNSAGWYDLSFTSPVKLAAGNYWIGIITGATSNVAAFRYDSVAGSRDYNANTYTSGPTNPFGAVTVDAEQTSLYATYSPG